MEANLTMKKMHTGDLYLPGDEEITQAYLRGDVSYAKLRVVCDTHLVRYCNYLQTNQGI